MNASRRGGQAEVLKEAGTLNRVRGDLDRARAAHRQALDLAENESDEAHARTLVSHSVCGVTARRSSRP